MDVNKLLKLIGPKLKQDELDVFLGVVLAADQCYGDSQVTLYTGSATACSLL